jgi:small nuclear ribonucleoprotein (snRNP)-like protein
MRNPMRKTTTIVVLLLSFLLSPLALAAQTAPTDWSRLNSLTGGTKLSVKLKDGKKVDGTFAAVSDTTLSLTVKNARKEVRREDVASVHEVGGTSVKKATLIGLGVGAGAGAALGIAGNASNDGGFGELPDSVGVGVAVLVAGAGALTGFFIGKATKKRVLLYLSK